MRHSIEMKCIATSDEEPEDRRPHGGGGHGWPRAPSRAWAPLSPGIKQGCGAHSPHLAMRSVWTWSLVGGPCWAHVFRLGDSRRDRTRRNWLWAAWKRESFEESMATDLRDAALQAGRDLVGLIDQFSPIVPMVY